MKRFAGRIALFMLPAFSTMPVLHAAEDIAKPARTQDALFLTATNGTPNYLAVINTRTRDISYVPTGGDGGASGNAGGVAVSGRMIAVVNFSSGTVTVFLRQRDGIQAMQTIKTASRPVSVTFGHGHLVVLGQTTAESFAVNGARVATTSDGTVNLSKADNSAAHIVAFDGGIVYSEKSGSIAMLNLGTDGVATGLTGPNRAVELPAAPNNDTPFGMVARGKNVYASIAHSDRQALITNGRIASIATSGLAYRDSAGNFTHAPCWNALWGQFLYSADSPARQLVRYLVSDSNVFYDKPAVATFSGSPTDLVVEDTMLGAISGTGANWTASLFDIGSEGELTLRFAVPIAASINGAAIVR